MPESGDQPNKSRNNGSNGGRRVPRQRSTTRDALSANGQGKRDEKNRLEDDRASHNQSANQGSKSFWQRLFGQRTKRTSRRTALKQTGTGNGAAKRIDLARGTEPNGRMDFGKRDGAWQTSLRDRFDSLSEPVTTGRRENTRRNGGQKTATREANSRPFAVLPSIRQHQARLSGRRDAAARSPIVPLNQQRSMVSNNAVNETVIPAQERTKRRDGTGKRRSKSFSAVLYATRLLILSVGVGVLAGTVLSVWDPANRSFMSQQPSAKKASVLSSTGQDSSSVSMASMATTGQEMPTLKAAMQALIMKNTQMTPGIFVMDLDTNDYVDLNGGATFSAASMIKVPILLAFFQDVDAGKMRLDEQLVLRKELVGSGSGDMQYDPVGTKYTALDVATKMIIISDNTATNLLIARLGGIRALNQRFKTWGLSATAINNLLPDLEGTNTTTPKELAFLLNKVSQGELVTMRSRDRILDIMRRTENHSQLRQGLGAGATIAHKTGDIGTLIGDTGLVDLPNGKRYVITVMVKRAFNDDRAYDFVSQFSRLAYLFFSRPAGTAATKSANPAVSPTVPAQSPSSNSEAQQASDESTNSADGATQQNDGETETP